MMEDTIQYHTPQRTAEHLSRLQVDMNDMKWTELFASTDYNTLANAAEYAYIIGNPILGRAFSDLAHNYKDA